MTTSWLRSRGVARGGIRAELLEQQASLFGGEPFERLLMGLLDRLGRRGPQQIAVALDRDLVVGASLGLGHILPADRLLFPLPCAEKSVEKAHGVSPHNPRLTVPVYEGMP